MKLILSSDFTDYYDHAFDVLKRPSIHHVFRRNFNGSTDRLEHFDYMKYQLDLLVPEYGTVKEVANRVRFDQSNKHVVVYTDPMKHFGDGKEKVGLKGALSRYPNYECSLFMPPDGGTSSYRFLSIGTKKFILKYVSDHKWKSNIGNVGVELVDGPVPNIESSFYPMFAIDFVISGGIPYAIDFNSAPRLTDTPVEGVLEPEEIVKEIREWMIQAMS